MAGKQKIPYSEIVAFVDANNGDKDLVASRFEIDKSTVSRALRMSGRRERATHTKSLVVLDASAVHRMYHDENMSTQEIAQRIGSSAESVRLCLKNAGSSRRNQGAQHGAKNPSWNGGIHIDKDGYVLVRMPSHPNATNGYVREHRLVMEKILGRFLLPTEVVHHKDGVHDNNSPDNLQLFVENSAHLKHELTGRVPLWTEEGLERIRQGQAKRCKKWEHQRQYHEAAATHPASETDAGQ